MGNLAKKELVEFCKILHLRGSNHYNLDDLRKILFDKLLYPRDTTKQPQEPCDNVNKQYAEVDILKGELQQQTENYNKKVQELTSALNGCALLEEENTSLPAKLTTLEDDLCKSCQEASVSQHLCQQLEKELKELKNYQLQVEPKRRKVISDLLKSVSKAERQEARLKVRHDSERLGNFEVIRAGTVIYESWKDGQAIKDLNARQRHLLELREAVESRKPSKKKQPDKGDRRDAESGVSEEDIIIQDEIYKSRLASIECEEEFFVGELD